MTNKPDAPANEHLGEFGESCILHASCVAIDQRAVLVLGPSGSGKSSLALQLMALGAVLVADDRTSIQSMEYGILASVSKPIEGLIEARGVGLLSAEVCSAAQIQLVVDLTWEERERLPQERKYNLLGHSLPLLHNVKAAHFPAAILQYLKGGRSA